MARGVHRVQDLDEPPYRVPILLQLSPCAVHCRAWHRVRNCNVCTTRAAGREDRHLKQADERGLRSGRESSRTPNTTAALLVPSVLALGSGRCSHAPEARAEAARARHSVSQARAGRRRGRGADSRRARRSRPWPPSRDNHDRRGRLAALTPCTASLHVRISGSRLGGQPRSSCNLTAANRDTFGRGDHRGVDRDAELAQAIEVRQQLVRLVDIVETRSIACSRITGAAGPSGRASGLPAARAAVRT